MRQLERLLGADTLRDGLRVYLKQFEFGNATWLDLIKVLDERTDRDLAAWSRVWVEEAGRPLVRTEWETNPEGRRQIAFVQRDPKVGPLAAVDRADAKCCSARRPTLGPCRSS